MQAYFEHFAELDAELNASELAILKELLIYGPAYSAPDLRGFEQLVVPRIGTISPWSSKATDIARNCGLNKLVRLERGIRYTFAGIDDVSADELEQIAALIHDRMTESCGDANFAVEKLFRHHEPAPLEFIPVGAHGRDALVAANTSLGLALSDDEIDYLLAIFAAAGRDPTDTELMMFSQANSEHCRHKIFNATWFVDGENKIIACST